MHGHSWILEVSGIVVSAARLVSALMFDETSSCLLVRENSLRRHLTDRFKTTLIDNNDNYNLRRQYHSHIMHQLQSCFLTCGEQRGKCQLERISLISLFLSNIKRAYLNQNYVFRSKRFMLPVHRIGWVQ